MNEQELAKLEGLAIGLDQRGEKSAAQQVRWALAEIERLHVLVRTLTHENVVLRERPTDAEVQEAARRALEGK